MNNIDRTLEFKVVHVNEEKNEFDEKNFCFVCGCFQGGGGGGGGQPIAS